MLMYFVTCAILLFMIFFKVYAEIVEFKRKYPHAILKETGWQKSICDLLKVWIMMCIPLLNVAIFWCIFCYYSDSDFEKIIWNKCANSPIE